MNYMGRRNGDPYPSGYELLGYGVAHADATPTIDERLQASPDIDKSSSIMFRVVTRTSGPLQAPQSWRVTCSAKY